MVVEGLQLRYRQLDMSLYSCYNEVMKLLLKDDDVMDLIELSEMFIHNISGRQYQKVYRDEKYPLCVTDGYSIFGIIGEYLDGYWAFEKIGEYDPRLF